MTLNTPTRWMRHNKGERLARTYSVVELIETDEEGPLVIGYAVRIQATQIGVTPIDVALCNLREDADHICALLNDDLQRL